MIGQVTEETRVDRWKTRLEIAAAAIGTTALIQFVGGAKLFWRFHEADIPPAQMTSKLPKDLMFVQGAKLVLPLVLLGLVGAGLTYALLRAPTRAQRRDGDGDGELPVRYTLEASGSGPPETRRWTLRDRALAAPPENPSGSLGGRLIVVTAVLLGLCLVGAAWLSASTDLAFKQSAFVFGLAVAAPVLAAAAMWGTRGVGAPMWIVFWSLVLFGAGVAMAVEVTGEGVQLDLAAVERKDGTRVGGFLVAQTDDHVYLFVRRRFPNDPDHADQVVAVSRGDVAQLVFGPRGVTVSAGGFRRGRKLARLLDASPPRLTVAAPRRQSLRAGALTVRAGCDERCYVTVHGAIRLRDGSRAILEPKRRTLRRPAVQRIRFKFERATHRGRSIEIASLARQRPLRVRFLVIAHDLARNPSETSVTRPLVR